MSMPTCPTCKYAKGVCGKTGVPIRRSTGCTYYEPKPQTNADRIRCWSDEEIADFTIGVADGVFTLFTGYKMPNDKREEMKMYWLDWLKTGGE